MYLERGNDSGAVLIAMTDQRRHAAVEQQRTSRMASATSWARLPGPARGALKSCSEAAASMAGLQKLQ